jgi:hypothetical protein
MSRATLIVILPAGWADPGDRIPWSLENILPVCIAFYKYVFINSTYVQVNKTYASRASERAGPASGNNRRCGGGDAPGHPGMARPGGPITGAR